MSSAPALGGSADICPVTPKGNSSSEATKNKSSISITPSSSSSSASSSSALRDEYGAMDSSGSSYVVDSLLLDSGETLREAMVRYKTFGKLNTIKDNVVVVCHALTGNASLDSWWGSLLGPGKAFDTEKYFVVCANVLGSCYGTCSPLSINPETGKPYGVDFPHVTIRDCVRLHGKMLREALNLDSVLCVVGGSMGGMQALEWSLLQPVKVNSIVVLSSGGRHSPWQIAVSELQRQAIVADPKWQCGRYDPESPPSNGLAVARQIAMVSYRTHSTYETKFGRRLQQEAHEAVLKKNKLRNSPTSSHRGSSKKNGGDGDGGHDGSNSSSNNNDESGNNNKNSRCGCMERKGEEFQVESYLHYQGQKFLKRKFDANCYVTLTQMMDSHDVARGRGEYLTTLNSISQPAMVIGISSDVLYPVSEQEELHKYLGNSEFHVIDSEEGHDGFLLEQSQIGPLIAQFMDRQSRNLKFSHFEKVQCSMQEEIELLKKQNSELLSQMSKLLNNS